MLVVLSQKIDSKSDYADELFRLYHYPARYKNQLNEGDVFVYYQGNRHDKSQRYYFGVGRIGEISTTDGENYYAKLIECQRFEKIVPIYLPDGGYIEQLGYETVRNNINPPWQSSIRPISEQAFDFILNAAGMQYGVQQKQSVELLQIKLKEAVRRFFVEKDNAAILQIESIAADIAKVLKIKTIEEGELSAPVKEVVFKQKNEEVIDSLLQYCENMKMSYSYKPVLILALLNAGEKNGSISIDTAAKYFRKFYSDRMKKGLCIEKKKCIYLKSDVTDKQITANLISNPIRVLAGTDYFLYDEGNNTFSMVPAAWEKLNLVKKEQLAKICIQKLREYYSE